MIYQGDARSVLSGLNSECVDMCMTSPPYWGLRDYGNEQIFGGDRDCEHGWGREKKKITGRNDGDRGQLSAGSYDGSRVGDDKYYVGKQEASQGRVCIKCNAWKGQLGLEPTPELYIEHMTAVFHEVKRVLKKEGTLWLNIGDTYNSTGTHTGEKSIGKWPKAFYDGVYASRTTDSLQPKCLCMIPERLAWSLIQDGWILRNKIIWYKPNGMPSSVKDRFTNKYEFIYMFSCQQKYYFDLDAVREEHSFNRWSMSNPIGSKRAVEAAPGQTQHSWQRKGHSGYYDGDGNLLVHPLGKNPGDVFTIPTQPFPQAHFAVFPEKLCRKPIKAGCPEGGTVLDPFCGAGTVGVVAKELGRNFIGIDIKEEYCEMAEKRIAKSAYQMELL